MRTDECMNLFGFVRNNPDSEILQVVVMNKSFGQAEKIFKQIYGDDELRKIKQVKWMGFVSVDTSELEKQP